MKLLVTGGCGFIGANLINKLLKLGHDVTTIDNLSTGCTKNLAEGINFIEGDCQDDEVISKLNGSRFDSILHLAGQSSGEISFDDPVYDLQTNTQSTLMLLDYAKWSGCKKFIYASSMSVYGNSTIQPVSEDLLPIPVSFYAIGKLASEHYLRTYSNYGIQAISLRLFNVYGPGQNLGNLRQGMVSIYLAQAIKNKKIVVKGAGERFRDLVYVEDVTSSFCKAIEFREKGYHCFNIGSGIPTSVHDIVNEINHYFKNNLSVDYVEPTPGDMHGIYSDSSLALEKIGWSFSTPFREGFAAMYDWAVGQ